MWASLRQVVNCERYISVSGQPAAGSRNHPACEMSVRGVWCMVDGTTLLAGGGCV